MQTEYELMKQKLIIMVPEELDHHRADKLRADTDLLIDMYHIRQLVFDFSHTEFMDSSGIGVLIGRYKNMSYKDGTVYARHMNDRVFKIFKVSGLGKIIQVENE